jgi:hypothetical protein
MWLFGGTTGQGFDIYTVSAMVFCGLAGFFVINVMMNQVSDLFQYREPLAVKQRHPA